VGIAAKSTRAVRRGLHCRPAFILAAMLHDLARYVRSGEFVLALIRDARAIAFYRHFVGIPTDREPPAAR